MSLSQLLYDQASFDGVHFFNNYIGIGSLQIKFYALCIMLGMVTCVILAVNMFKKQGLNPDLILDLMIAIIPLAIVGARAWYVVNAIDEFDSFIDMINIRNGGLAIIGGVMGGALAVLIISKIKKVKFLEFADIACILLPVGQAIGRWGNFFNMEVYGMESSYNFFPFAVYIGTATSGSWHVPLFLIESLLNLALFFILYFIFKRKKYDNHGYFMCSYFIGYGIIRSVLEPLRDPRFNLTGVSDSGVLTQQLTSMIAILLGLGLLIYYLYRDKKLFFKNLKTKKDYKYTLLTFEGIVLVDFIFTILLCANVLNIEMSNYSFVALISLFMFGLSLLIFGIIQKGWKERSVGICLLAIGIVFVLIALKLPVVIPIIVGSLFVVCGVIYVIFVLAPRMEKEKEIKKEEELKDKTTTEEVEV